MVAIRRKIRDIVLVFICICVVGIVYFCAKLERKRTISMFMTGIKGLTTPTGLKIVHPSQFANETGFKCVNASIEGLSFPICAYSAEEDIYVSQPLYSGGYFEQVLVTKFINFFRTHIDITFVDLGANIGLYSLPMAHLGRHVVAVEPNPDTYRRLAKSIHLGGVSSHIDAVNYALADVDQTTAVLQIDLINRGDSFLTTNVTCASNCSVVVPTTTLDRLLPLIRNRKVVIKADVQESEIRIFTETGAGLFFKKVDIPIIMIEWDQYRRLYAKEESKRRLVDQFLEFFHKRDYEIYDPKSEEKLSANWTNWPFEVIFKKRALPTDTLFSL